MNILFILENYYPHLGGVEVLFRNLCEGLADLGHNISIVTHRIKGTKEFEIINKVNVYRVNCMHSRYFFTFLAIPKVFKLAKECDMIHTTTFNGAFPAWFVSKLLRKKCIININEVWVGRWTKITEMNWLNAKIHEILEKMIYLLNFDRYVAISKATQKQLLDIGVDKNKIDVIYCGVDYKHWNPKLYKNIKKKLGLEDNFVYLFSGRPGVSKGLEYLIKAVPLISSKIPNSKLLAIVSKDKAYKKRLDHILRLIKQLKIEDKVIIHDPVQYKELPNYIKSADCVVVPSLAEGFGFAAAEACAMNIPVVASDTTSLPEVVSGKYVLVKPKDEKSIAEGVIDIFNGKYNKTKLRLFKKEDFIKKHLDLYKNMLR